MSGQMLATGPSKAHQRPLQNRVASGSYADKPLLSSKLPGPCYGSYAKRITDFVGSTKGAILALKSKENGGRHNYYHAFSTT